MRTAFQQAAAATEQLEDGLRRAFDRHVEAQTPYWKWPVALRLWAVELVRANLEYDDSL